MYEEDYKSRQVQLMIEGSKVAVLNSSKNSEWQPASCVILKGKLSTNETIGLGIALPKARKLMDVLSNNGLTRDDLETLIYNINDELSSCQMQSNDE